MIVGIGTDVVELERVRVAWARHGARFAERVLSPGERAALAAWPPQRQVEFLAGRFAAKEAVAKAAGCGIGRLGMSQVEMVVTGEGLSIRWLDARHAPYRTGRWHVSISHSRTTAFAVAVWELDGPADGGVSPPADGTRPERHTRPREADSRPEGDGMAGA